MIVLFLFSFAGLHAQSDELVVQGKTGNLHLDHPVAAKENWYSVGRLYNVDPKALAKYNHLTFAHPLGIGEELKIPLTAENFSQDGKKPANETLVPVYHIVLEKEWLYRISVNHNKVPIPVLEKWNHVTGDQVHAGVHLIVGYLKVKTALSALAKQAPARIARAVMEPPAVRESKEAAVAAGNKREEPVAGTDKKEEPVAGGEKKQDAAAAGERKTEEQTFNGDRGASSLTDRQADSGSMLYRPKPHQPAPPVQAVQAGSLAAPAPHFGGGKFRDDFSDGGHTVRGAAGIFKSTSGWQDGKYYALINDIPVGTIIKITDQSTGKVVYAKVLGQMPEMKESVGLTIRLSNAAAAELGESDAGKFGVGVSY